MDEITLSIHYDRFGVLAKPFKPQLGFDYNRIYYTIPDLVKDFYLHGWELIATEGEPFGYHSYAYYTFRRKGA